MFHSLYVIKTFLLIAKNIIDYITDGCYNCKIFFIIKLHEIFKYSHSGSKFLYSFISFSYKCSSSFIIADFSLVTIIFWFICLKNQYRVLSGRCFSFLDRWPGHYLRVIAQLNRLMTGNRAKFYLITTWQRSTWKAYKPPYLQCFCCLHFFPWVDQLLINVIPAAQSNNVMMGGCEILDVFESNVWCRLSRRDDLEKRMSN